MLTLGLVAELPSMDFFQIECLVRNPDLASFTEFSIFNCPQKMSNN